MRDARAATGGWLSEPQVDGAGVWLQAGDGTVKKILQFDGEYRFLSNFYPAKVSYAGREYPAVENAYQAAKTNKEKTLRVQFENVSAGQAKHLGRKIPLRK